MTARRPADLCLRDRRARHPRDRCGLQGQDAAGQDAAGRHGSSSASSATTRSRRRSPHTSLTPVGRAECDRDLEAAGPARGRGHAARPRNADAPPAGFRLHAGGPAPADRADGSQGRGGDRLDGQRHPAGRCCASARSCSTTTSSSFSRRSPTRPSTRSARRWSCRTRQLLGAWGQPPATRRPSTAHLVRMPHPVITNEELEKLRACADGRLPHDDAADASSTCATARPGWSSALDSAVRQRVPRRAAAATRMIILSDRGVDRQPRADSRAAGRGRPAPSPDPRGPARRRRASSSRPARRAKCMHFALLIGYGAGAINPYLAFETIADMVSTEHAARRVDAGRRPHRGGGVQELHQGRGQGAAEDHVQDGHLDAAELPRRADLRGDRPEPRGGGPLLHGRPPRGSAASGSRRSPARPCAPPPRIPRGALSRASRCSTRAASTSWRRDGE